ncbi:MAG: hypothetical protein E7376_00675 [Clostridiales bacterium]|nr:hypothetical protein [Clostridiales bacterium]
MKNTISVMDIGTSKIAVLMGNRGINNTLNLYASYIKDYAGYYNAEFVEPDKFTDDVCDAIAKAEINAGERIKKLFVGVPADFCSCITKQFMQNFGDKLKVEESDILEIYQQANELKDNDNYVLISCSPIYFVLDDGRKVINPIGEKTCRLSGEISYIYAEKAFISKINVALRKFGLSSVEYLSSTLSENMYLLSEKNREVPSIIVDCGYLSTSVSITKGNGLLSLNSFSVGGGQVTSDLSECLKISYKEAEELKKQIILSVVPELSDGYEISKQNKPSIISMTEANEVVAARLEMICSLINKCLTSTQKKDLYKMPFYLTGGGICFIKGAKDYLAKYFGVNVEILSPPNLQLSKPNYSAVLGLLNSAINQEQKHKTNKFLSFLKKITKR